MEEDWWLPNVLEGASVHIYLICAILAPRVAVDTFVVIVVAVA